MSFIDSTSLKICHNRHIKQYQVFANCGKTLVEYLRWGEALWFFGFKLHIYGRERLRDYASHLRNLHLCGDDSLDA
ncbi:hypothetical protein H6F76_16410 [Leptolyngbya sp. FACHB-321]|uniref:transposase n=1 Tax=Leptolyngbya sp. FACHB-321 TaxID=2692807 RepID=UPI00168738E6|nr:hypothetical protein [Leptolyngbya sp. FACHB-321]